MDKEYMEDLESKMVEDIRLTINQPIQNLTLEDFEMIELMARALKIMKKLTPRGEL